MILDRLVKEKTFAKLYVGLGMVCHKITELQRLWHNHALSDIKILKNIIFMTLTYLRRK